MLASSCFLKDYFVFPRYARKHFSSVDITPVEDLRKIMALLAFTPDTVCDRYKVRMWTRKKFQCIDDCHLHFWEKGSVYVRGRTFVGTGHFLVMQIISYLLVFTWRWDVPSRVISSITRCDNAIILYLKHLIITTKGFEFALTCSHKWTMVIIHVYFFPRIYLT